MKVLVDEKIDEAFPEFLPGHEAIHVKTLGWKGTRNGELLKRTEDADFDAMVTVDKNLRHQQDLSQRKFALFVLDIHPNVLRNQVACIPELTAHLESLTPGSVTVIEGPHPRERSKG